MVCSFMISSLAKRRCSLTMGVVDKAAKQIQTERVAKMWPGRKWCTEWRGGPSMVCKMRINKPDSTTVFPNLSQPKTQMMLGLPK